MGNPTRAPEHSAALRSRSFVTVLLATAATFGGYALLLPVTPLWAATGGADAGSAGAVTGVFMAVTVVSQLGAPRLIHAVGHRGSLVLGCLALGVPAALLPLSAAWAVILAVSAVRGVGFGIVTVTGSALVADLTPTAVRGRALGRYGLALGIPQLVGLPAAVWAWSVVGPVAVLLAGAALPLMAVPALLLLPRRVTAASDGDRAPRGSRAAGLRVGLPPWSSMVVCAAAAGGIITVLPLTGAAFLAGTALFALTAGQLLGRAGAGELTDRGVRHGRITPVALGGAGLGALLVAAGAGLGGVPGDGLALVGAALVGTGFGAVQNDTQVTLFARAGPARSGWASSVWNTAYDSGTGLGSTALAAVLAGAGAPAAFLCAGVACAVVLPIAWVDRTR